MEYRSLGKTGLQLSAFSFGSWVTFGTQLDVDQASELMKTAYDAGVNFFDNAEVYAQGAAEVMMGRVFERMQWPRDSYCVSSKVMFGSAEKPLPTQRGLSRKHVIEACDQAIARMKVDYLDLYLCHRPDPQVPVEETVRAMDILIKQGKVLYWGTSMWSPQQILEACLVAERYNLTPPALEQPQYNMFWREQIEKEYLPLYDSVGIGTTVWSPLATGVLTGKYNDGIPEDGRLNIKEFAFLKERWLGEGKGVIDRVRILTKMAEEMGTTMTKLALAWCLKNPNVSTVILGATKPRQLSENLAALDTVPLLTADVMADIEKVLNNKPVL